MPYINFIGKVLLSYYFFNNRQYTQKDLYEINVFDYCYFNDIISVTQAKPEATALRCDNENNIIKVFHSLKAEFVKVEIIDCEIKNNQLKINNELFDYIEDDDIFISFNIYNLIIRVHSIIDKCYNCKNENYLIPYCFGEEWICNNCIIDKEEY